MRADVPGCADLALLDSPARVGTFADCLRAVANAYRKGRTPALTKKLGVDTNYVAAMQAGRPPPPGRQRPPGADPLHRRQARREGHPGVARSR